MPAPHAFYLQTAPVTATPSGSLHRALCFLNLLQVFFAYQRLYSGIPVCYQRVHFLTVGPAGALLPHGLHFLVVVRVDGTEFNSLAIRQGNLLFQLCCELLYTLFFR